MTVQLPLPGVWPRNIGRRDPIAELDAITREKLDAKHELRQVLDKYADLHGISPKVINEVVWGYVDDMLGDMFFELEEELRTERDEAPESC
jgi:hypothetical protein